MKIEGNKNERFTLNLEFETEHEASTFQTMMNALIINQKDVLVEFKKDAEKMAETIRDVCLKMWG